MDGIKVLEWVQGFHPGRWILMDMIFKVMEEIRDLEDLRIYTTLYRSKDHIEDPSSQYVISNKIKF